MRGLTLTYRRLFAAALALCGIVLALACVPVATSAPIAEPTPVPTDEPTLTPVPTFGEADVVHAVLFYSPFCPHCHQVRAEVLPPLEEQYGNQLWVLEIDTSTPEGQQLYQSAVAHFNIAQDRRGVPTLIIDGVVLVGSEEIPQYLPSLIERGLQQEGGVDWPAIPGFVPPAN